MMKTNPFISLLITLLVLTINSINGQTKQQGSVVLINSGKQVVSGVQVMANGAAPVTSDQAGAFTLSFAQRQDGEMIMLGNAYKLGYEIVNEEVIKNWVISSKRSMVIELCSQGDLNQARMKYYEIGRTNNLARYNKAVEDIEKQKSAKKIAAAEYETNIESVTAEYRRAMELLDSYSLKLAQINQDNLNETERRAMQAIEQGDVMGAVAVFRDAKTFEMFQQLSANRDKVQEQMDQMVFSLKQYADICMFAGGVDNFRRADEILLSIALSDTTNYNYCKEYAEFTSGVIFDLEVSKQWFDKSLQAARNPQQKLEALTGIFWHNVYASKFDGIDDQFIEIVNAYDTIQTGAEFITEGLSSVYTSYATTLFLRDKQEMGLKVAEQGVVAAANLFKIDSVKYGHMYGITLGSYVGYLINAKKYTEAEKLATQIIDILSNVKGRWKMEADVWICSMLSTKAQIYSETDRLAEAVLQTNTALQAIAKNHELYPMKYAPLLMDASYLGAYLLAKLNMKADAINFLKEAVDRYVASHSIGHYDTYANALFYLLALAEQTKAQLPERYITLAIETCEKHIEQGKLIYSPHNRLMLTYMTKMMLIMPNETMSMFFNETQQVNTQTKEMAVKLEPVVYAATTRLYEMVKNGNEIDLNTVDVIGYYAYLVYGIHGIESKNKHTVATYMIDAHNRLKTKTHNQCGVPELMNAIKNGKK